jgi:hypothetical protein
MNNALIPHLLFDHGEPRDVVLNQRVLASFSLHLRAHRDDPDGVTFTVDHIHGKEHR